MSENKRPCHSLSLTIKVGYVDAAWSCDAPTGATCRTACPEQCDAWGETGLCEHEHAYVDSGECGVVTWLDNATWDETYSGPVAQVRSGRVVVEWNGDGYDWHYADEKGSPQAGKES